MRSIALALLLLVAPAARAGAPPEARAQKEQGDRLRKANDAEGAATAYRAALQLDGGYAEAHEALGELQFAAKQYEKAVESFGYAVEIDPAYALAWYNLAFAARRSGDQPKARSAYERYVKLRPTDADGHYGLAESQRALGDREAAVAEYQLFIDLAGSTPSQAPWVEKARNAIAELKSPPAPPPARTEPSTAVAGTALAVPIAAIPASSPGGKAPAAPPQLAAAPPYLTALPVPPSRALIEKLGAGDRAWLAGDYRTALFAYQDATYLAPTNPVGRIKQARAYAALHHQEEAERQLRQALELDPGNIEALELLESLRNPAAAESTAPAPATARTPAIAPRIYRLTDDAAAPAVTPGPAPAK